MIGPEKVCSRLMWRPRRDEQAEFYVGLEPGEVLHRYACLVLQRRGTFRVRTVLGVTHIIYDMPPYSRLLPPTP